MINNKQKNCSCMGPYFPWSSQAKGSVFKPCSTIFVFVFLSSS